MATRLLPPYWRQMFRVAGKLEMPLPLQLLRSIPAPVHVQFMRTPLMEVQSVGASQPGVPNPSTAGERSLFLSGQTIAWLQTLVSLRCAASTVAWALECMARRASPAPQLPSYCECPLMERSTHLGWMLYNLYLWETVRLDATVLLYFLLHFRFATGSIDTGTRFHYRAGASLRCLLGTYRDVTAGILPWKGVVKNHPLGMVLPFQVRG